MRRRKTREIDVLGGIEEHATAKLMRTATREPLEPISDCFLLVRAVRHHRSDQGASQVRVLIGLGIRHRERCHASHGAVRASRGCQLVVSTDYRRHGRHRFHDDRRRAGTIGLLVRSSLWSKGGFDPVHHRSAIRDRDVRHGRRAVPGQ